MSFQYISGAIGFRGDLQIPTGRLMLNGIDIDENLDF